MSVNSTVRTAGPYLGTGLVATYPFAFKVFQASDILVVETTAGVQTTMTLTTDYTVSLNSDQNNNPGGSITLMAGNLPSPTTLTMTSQVPQTQGQTIANFSGFLPSVLTDAYDKLTILVQQLAQLLGRGITFPISDGTSLNSQLPVASARANQFVSFDALGNVTTSSGLASVPVSSAMAPVVGAVSLGYASQLLDQGNIASAAAAFSDTNVLEQSTFSANSYVQDITQNTNSGAAASADIVVANNLATATTFYGNFGMNSSGFTGSGAFNKASAVYLTATFGDLAIGTTTANAIHFVYNNGATDSAYIDSTGFNAPAIGAGVSGTGVFTSLKINANPVWTQRLVSVISTSGTFNRNANTVELDLEAWGAGGAGGSAQAIAAGLGGGSGGAAGCYSKKRVTAATFGASQTVTIGAAGVPGAAGNNPGGAGGQTSVGSLCIANGGPGGLGTSGAGVGGSSTGAAGTGDITSTGQPGDGCLGSSASTSFGGMGGKGGTSTVGAGAIAFVAVGAAVAGVAGTGNASGGSGASCHASTGTAAGGAGTKGLVVITEYISA